MAEVQRLHRFDPTWCEHSFSNLRRYPREQYRTNSDMKRVCQGLLSKVSVKSEGTSKIVLSKGGDTANTPFQQNLVIAECCVDATELRRI